MFFLQTLREYRAKKPVPYRKPHNRWHLAQHSNNFYIRVTLKHGYKVKDVLKRYKIQCTHQSQWDVSQRQQFLLLGNDSIIDYLLRIPEVREAARLNFAGVTTG